MTIFEPNTINALSRPQPRRQRCRSYPVPGKPRPEGPPALRYQVEQADGSRMQWEVLDPVAEPGSPPSATQALTLPHAHHYPVSVVRLALNWVCGANTSLRATAKGLLLGGADTAPSFWTIRLWILRLGLYELQRRRPQASDWVLIVDATITVGQHKALVVLGVRLGQMLRRGFNLGHQAVELLGLEILLHCNGPAVERALNAAARAVGVPCQVVSDAGGEVKKGVQLFQGAHPEVVWTYDITHQFAHLLKNELGTQGWWGSFLTQVNACRQACQQTAWSHLLPPAPRTKARWLNVQPLVSWALQVLAYEQRTTERDQDFQRLFGWLHAYEAFLHEAQQCLQCLEVVSRPLKQHGLNRSQIRQCLRALRQLPLSARACAFGRQVINCLRRQVAHAKPGQTLLSSSDVIESLFGKFKAVVERSSLHALTAMILIIGALTSDRTEAVIQAAMEQVSTLDVRAWFSANGESSLLSKRRQALDKSAEMEGIKTA